ncbi:MFS transporter [Photobacterium rosenbergii]|uniref:MFS transporter n=1 Tax=Photobacterium rosenbergii TaxID=294936 RepID=A0ABU3ZI58_9GAMM|nr:MFS transporter [Photobacterium rosenbergii]MDV5169789.1 MFS transporter [Photobacterium rosenbergii]
MMNLKHMSEVSIQHRILAYIVLLAGHFFYAYNFVIIDYVRPFIVDSYDSITLAHTAQFYTWQSVGALLGAIVAAKIAGKRGLIFVALLNGAATLVNIALTDYMTWSIARLVIGFSLGAYATIAFTVMTGMFPSSIRGKMTAFLSSMFSVALIFMGGYAAYLSSIDAPWQGLMVAGGLPPIIIAGLMALFIPSEKRYIAFGAENIEKTETGEEKKGSWGEMFSVNYRRFTICCLLLAGLNFYGYQFFSGFVTTYLKEVRMFDAATVGLIFSIASFGNLVGGWVWGAISDKWGRKVNAFGFILAGVMSAAFFVAPSNVEIMGLNLLAILGLLYNFGLSSSLIWGGYFIELFPSHLRGYGAALFHGGRIIGMWAPMVLVFIQSQTSLETAMWGSPIVWFVAAFVWLSLPETVKHGVFAKNKSDQLATEK